jgi:hypothetical protein
MPKVLMVVYEVNAEYKLVFKSKTCQEYHRGIALRSQRGLTSFENMTPIDYANATMKL